MSFVKHNSPLHFWVQKHLPLRRGGRMLTLLYFSGGFPFLRRKGGSMYSLRRKGEKVKKNFYFIYYSPQSNTFDDSLKDRQIRRQIRGVCLKLIYRMKRLRLGHRSSVSIRRAG